MQILIYFINKRLTVAIPTKKTELNEIFVILVSYMKLNDWIVCQIKCFCFFYKHLFSRMSRLTMGLHRWQLTLELVDFNFSKTLTKKIGK